MYTMQIRNRVGESYQISGKEKEYQITNISGLNPPSAQVNLSNVVGLDGGKFNSAKLNTRNIVLTLKINGEGADQVEENRQNLYRFFPTKQLIRFFFQNKNRNVYIDGYVDSFEVGLFDQVQMAQISIICPYPYFTSQTVEISDVSDNYGVFTFPFSIEEDDPIPFSIIAVGSTGVVYNGSEGDTGCTIEVDFTDSVSSLSIRNVLTGEEFGITYNFIADDKLIINTQKGDKSVTLVRAGVRSNLFAYIVHGSVFFQLESGDNYFVYDADNMTMNETVYINFIHRDNFRGV